MIVDSVDSVGTAELADSQAEVDSQVVVEIVDSADFQAEAASPARVAFQDRMVLTVIVDSVAFQEEVVFQAQVVFQGVMEAVDLVDSVALAQVASQDLVAFLDRMVLLVQVDSVDFQVLVAFQARVDFLV